MQTRLRINPKFKKVLIGFLLIVAVYILMVLALRAIGLDQVQAGIRHLGIWAPVAFVLLCTLSMILAPLSSSSLFITGGVLFGQQVGFILSFLSSVLGCCINFWISRKLGRRVAARFIGHNNLDNLDRFTHRLNTHQGILFMMVILPLSQDMLSYAIGLTKIRFWQFFIAILVSGLAVVGTAVYFGSGIIEALT